ncbi:MAG: hypothetical protein BGO49_04025 [Planctomycetales bacterium 71-10]|nr:MAG: hypothetical protein BGO49_04025 [Planctomycetales bacterium 71-10]
MATSTTRPAGNEATILGRLLSRGDDPMPVDLARYITTLDFTGEDRARMDDLAARNREDALSPEERAELEDFARAGTVLAILQSKARRALAGARP